jgi:hypothetical protein
MFASQGSYAAGGGELAPAAARRCQGTPPFAPTPRPCGEVTGIECRSKRHHLAGLEVRILSAPPSPHSCSVFRQRQLLQDLVAAGRLPAAPASASTTSSSLSPCRHPSVQISITAAISFPENHAARAPRDPHCRGAHFTLSRDDFGLWRLEIRDPRWARRRRVLLTRAPLASGSAGGD